MTGYLCHRLRAVVGHLGEHMQSGVVVNTEALHQDALGLSDEIVQGANAAGSRPIRVVSLANYFDLKKSGVA